MAFTQADVNEHDFSEVTLSDKQPLVTNNLGRAVDPFVLVLLDGWFREVREYDGIADTAEVSHIQRSFDTTAVGDDPAVMGQCAGELHVSPALQKTMGATVPYLADCHIGCTIDKAALQRVCGLA